MSKEEKTNGNFAALTEEMRILEALLFASDEILSPPKLKKIMPGEPDGRQIRTMVNEINAHLQRERHPFEIVEIGGGYQIRTVAYYHPWVRKLLQEKTVKKLSIQALECLAIIAYKQPLSKAEIESIRGVLSDGAMKTLLERRLVTVGGRSDKPGRPLLYITTPEFLRYFGLNKLEDLPSIEEFEAIAREKMEEISDDALSKMENEAGVEALEDQELDEAAVEAQARAEAQAHAPAGAAAATQPVTDILGEGLTAQEVAEGDTEADGGDDDDPPADDTDEHEDDRAGVQAPAAPADILGEAASDAEPAASVVDLDDLLDEDDDEEEPPAKPRLRIHDDSLVDEPAIPTQEIRVPGRGRPYATEVPVDEDTVGSVVGGDDDQDSVIDVLGEGIPAAGEETHVLSADSLDGEGGDATEEHSLPTEEIDAGHETGDTKDNG